MAIKTYKPTTPSRRHMTVSAFEGIDKKAKPERSLLENLKKHAGRNSYGRITVRHRGGGNKRKYRIIDFKRQKDGVEATVIRLEYDPNRSANIALIQYTDGEKAYILAPVGLKPGHKIVSGPEADILPGNCLPIANIPVGELIHNIELYPGKGAQLVRSAGVAGQLMAKENGMASSTTSSSTPARALSWCAPPAWPASSWPRRTAWLRSVCPPARSAISARSARLASVRWATPTTPMSRSVRLAASATWAGGPPSAAPS